MSLSFWHYLHFHVQNAPRAHPYWPASRQFWVVWLTAAPAVAGALRGGWIGHFRVSYFGAIFTKPRACGTRRTVVVTSVGTGSGTCRRVSNHTPEKLYGLCARQYAGPQKPRGGSKTPFSNQSFWRYLHVPVQNRALMRTGYCIITLVSNRNVYTAISMVAAPIAMRACGQWQAVR